MLVHVLYINYSDNLYAVNPHLMLWKKRWWCWSNIEQNTKRYKAFSHRRELLNGEKYDSSRSSSFAMIVNIGEKVCEKIFLKCKGKSKWARCWYVFIFCFHSWYIIFSVFLLYIPGERIDIWNEPPCHMQKPKQCVCLLLF